MKAATVFVLIWLAVLALELVGFLLLRLYNVDATVQFYIFFVTVGIGIPIVLAHEILWRRHHPKRNERLLNEKEEK